MPDKVIGVYLIGGPPGLDGHKNAYDASMLGGWPPPEELGACLIHGSVAIAQPEKVPSEHRHLMTWYRKVGQSQIPDAPEEGDMSFRGATYELKET